MQKDLGGSVGATVGERFMALDSLRGVCAILVALFHFQTIGRIHNSALVLHSYMFVDFFFVLSGFVISASYGARLEHEFSIRKFLLLRLGRIYPLHAAMILLFLCTQIAGMLFAPSLASRSFFQGENGLPQIVFGLLFIQIFLGTEETWYNSPSWSISAEMWAYAVAALLFRACRGRVLLGAVVVSGGAYVLYALSLRHGINAHHWGALPRCLFSFGLGVIAFQAYAAMRVRGIVRLPSLFASMIELAAAGIALLLVIQNNSLMGPLAFAAIVLIFAYQSGSFSKVLMTPPMLLLGSLSYSIYMIHSFVQARVINALSLLSHRLGRPDMLVDIHGSHAVGISPMVADGITVAMVALVVALAWCTFQLIEKPGQLWSRRLVLGRRGDRTIVAEKRATTI